MPALRVRLTRGPGTPVAHTRERTEGGVAWPSKAFPCKRLLKVEYQAERVRSSLNSTGPTSPTKRSTVSPSPKKASRETRSSSLPKVKRTPAATSRTSYSQETKQPCLHKAKCSWRGRLPPITDASQPSENLAQHLRKKRRAPLSERPRSERRVRCTARTWIPTRAPAT